MNRKFKLYDIRRVDHKTIQSRYSLLGINVTKDIQPGETQEQWQKRGCPPKDGVFSLCDEKHWPPDVPILDFTGSWTDFLSLLREEGYSIFEE